MDGLDLFGAAQVVVDNHCLGCGQTHPEAQHVTLVDGTASHSYSAAWRLECEARSILNMRPLVRRQAHLDKIAKGRGAEAADQLRDAMAAVWNARQAEKMRA